MVEVENVKLCLLNIIKLKASSCRKKTKNNSIKLKKRFETLIKRNYCEVRKYFKQIIRYIYCIYCI